MLYNCSTKLKKLTTTLRLLPAGDDFYIHYREGGQAQKLCYGGRRDIHPLDLRERTKDHTKQTSFPALPALGTDDAVRISMENTKATAFELHLLKLQVLKCRCRNFVVARA